ncbi:MAG: GNAT family N-acetyltransferase [Gaiellaceae bacterium]
MKAEVQAHMEIRRAESGDVAAIRAIVEVAYAPYEPRIGRVPAPVVADYPALVAAGDAWVCISDGRVVGVLVIRQAGDALELENVAVDPACQRRGYGRALIAFAEQQARELGLGTVTLYTNEAMVENLRLYPRLGFAETERRVEDGYRRVFFEKSLDDHVLRS